MKKSTVLLSAAVLCMGLTGCSAVGVASGGVLVVLGAALAGLTMMRGQSLSRMRRSRGMTKKKRAWLRRQIAMTNKLWMFALMIVLTGVAVALIGFGSGEKPEDKPATVPSDPTVIVTEAPTDAPTIPTEATDPTEYTEYVEETEPDLIGIPESLLELMEKNPETTDFVLNYYNRQPVEIDFNDIDRSAGVPLFLQWDQRWGYEIYGSDVIAITGCAPTCAAMAGYYLTGDERFTPDQMAEFAAAGDYYVAGHGTKWTFIGEGIEELGLVTKELPLAEGVIIQSLRSGSPVIVVVGPGDFTTTGHFMVITDYVDGKFRINDPNSVIRSEQLWSYEVLEPQIRNLWSVRVG